MDRLDTDRLHAYAARDWSARGEPAVRPIEEKIQIATEVYEAKLAPRPTGPTRRRAEPTWNRSSAFARSSIGHA